MKQITVKFTRTKGLLPAVMMKLFRHKFTHTAISMDSENFYSFTHAGFIKESRKYVLLKDYKPKYVYLQFDVDDDIHEAISQEIKRLKEQKISYSHWSVIFAFLKLPIPLKNRYTCSYFVADLLQSYHAYPLKRKASVYLPHDLFMELKVCQQIFSNDSLPKQKVLL